MNKYALDKSMLPKVWLTWATTKNKQFEKRFWLNCQTEQKKDKPESWMTYTGEDGTQPKLSGWSDKGGFGINYDRIRNGKIWVPANSKVYLTYAKYHKNIDRLEVSVVKLDTKRNGEGNRWSFPAERFFIGKDKSVVDENGLTFGLKMKYDDRPYHYAYTAKYLLGSMLRNPTTIGFLDEFKKFIGGDSFTIGNGTNVDINADWHLARWYETVQKQRNTTSKRQKQIDELVKMPLSDCSDLASRYPEEKISHRWGEDTINHIVYFERINDKWSVLRHFYNRVNETWRVYLNDDKKIFIVSKNGENDWISATQQKHSWGNYVYLANPEVAMEKCPRIRYILSAAGDINKTDIVDTLITALRFPEIEQLMKFGYTKLAKNASLNSFTKATLKDHFGNYYNDKGTNLLKKIGMTKKQLDIYMVEENARALSMMRRMFGEDLSPMDIDSFTKYYNACNCMQHQWYGDVMADIKRCCPNDNEYALKIFKNIVRLYNKEPRAYTILRDTLNACRWLNRVPEIDWCFDDVSDLTRTHDAIIELKRIQDEERRALWNMSEQERRKKEDESRKKIDEERKHYEYEDDNYIIRLPKDCAEIVMEGSVQHICIGGYTGSHSNGYTNLFFLRKKSEPDKPFYAIEMGNDKQIKQIHGFGNRWLGNDPEAIPTVIRWLRKHGIKCTDAILTCTSTGYGQRDNYVAMPVVD